MVDRLRPMLLLEINEVPWRVVDYACARGLRHVQRFFSRAATFTTVSEDTGELSPWITWPSFHRGMTNEEHGIQVLGQDVSTFRGVPIWEEFRKKGQSIGIFGSLQSWPPIEPGPGGFYVPDTFAHDERCVPDYVEPLQRFNLMQVRRNGRVVERGMPLVKDVLSVIPAALRTRLPLKLYAEVAQQLVGERLDPTRCGRRTTFQTLLFWEVFKHLYDPKRPPAFSTFFTNHVASAMHRYWDALFPEDFGRAPGSPHPHRATIEFSLEVMDRLLGEALAFTDANPDLLLVVASSMGQGAVKREHHGLEVVIRSLGELLGKFGIGEGAFTPLLAMVPQVAASVPDATARERLTSSLLACRAASGESIFRIEQHGASVSITLLTPTSRKDVEAGGFRTGDGAWIRWEDAGIQVVETEPGTAYHIPEGILAVVGEHVPASDARARMRAADVKKMLLELSGLETPAQRRPRAPVTAAS